MKKKQQKPSNQKVWDSLILEAAIKYYEQEDKRRLRNLKKLDKLLKGERK